MDKKETINIKKVSAKLEDCAVVSLIFLCLMFFMLLVIQHFSLTIIIGSFILLTLFFYTFPELFFKY